MGNNLRKLRDNRGWTHQQAADAMGVSRGQFIKLERGERRLTADYIAMACRAFSVEPSEVLGERASVMIVGHVGAGEEAFFADGQGPFGEVPAPSYATDSTVAVEIRGTSLGELFDRWLVFYDDIRTPPTRDMMGRLCVVGLADGRVVVKKITRGHLPGTYTLLSNVGPPMYDLPVLWAATVNGMAPR